MIGRTLSFYFAKHFLFFTLMIFGLFIFLIMTADMVELSRAASKKHSIPFLDLATIAAFRAPGLAQRILPFAVMFGASASLMVLNKRLELVVVRAAGVSVWQFILPAAASAALLGIIAATVFNPVALKMKQISQATEARAFGKVRGSFSNATENFWLRVGQSGSDVIIRAKVSENEGRKLTALSVYRFGKDGESIERIDAESALFFERETGLSIYRLTNASVSKPGVATEEHSRIDLPVNISASQLQVNTSQTSNISFWDLPRQAERAAEAGRNPLVFSTEFHSQIANSLLFVGMVILSACVSLRFARFGLNAKLIFGGVAAGFVLYVLSRLTLAFGNGGLVAPVAAAWAVALVATMIGVTVLLYQEDG